MGCSKHSDVWVQPPGVMGSDGMHQGIQQNPQGVLKLDQFISTLWVIMNLPPKNMIKQI